MIILLLNQRRTLFCTCFVSCGEQTMARKLVLLLFIVTFAYLVTAFIPGPGGPCPNCPSGWWCCGKDDLCFNATTFLCCGDIVTATCGERSKCCGSSCYNEEEEVCCNGGTVQKKCGDNAWCCGTQCYQPDSQHCCNGEVFTCTTGYVCCGRGCHNPDSQLCCQGNISEKCGDETACCGDRCYDTTKERCDIDRGQFIIRKRFFRPQ